MSGLFYCCPFNQNLSNWNVSKVNNMDRMFSYSEFNNDSISNWDVSNIENFELTFKKSIFHILNI